MQSQVLPLSAQHHDCLILGSASLLRGGTDNIHRRSVIERERYLEISDLSVDILQSCVRLAVSLADGRFPAFFLNVDFVLAEINIREPASMQNQSTP